MSSIKKRLMEIFALLQGRYGPRNWWPVTPSGESVPQYRGGPVDDRQRFEVAVGAVLTQNTSWKNASAAIENLNRAGMLSPEGIYKTEESRLAEIIRPSGYYNMKAKKLLAIAAFFLRREEVSRDSLLEVHGVGPETADSILLYAYRVPVFVVDSYTRRMFSRIGMIEAESDYEKIRAFFQDNLASRAELFQEYHALIVENSKSVCRKAPLCARCPLPALCRHAME